MRFLLRLLLIFIVITSVLSLIRNLFRPLRPSPRPRQPEPEAPPRASSGHLVKDPVCGTYIPDDSRFRANDVCFCSEECRKKYLAAG